MTTSKKFFTASVFAVVLIFGTAGVNTYLFFSQVSRYVTPEFHRTYRHSIKLEVDSRNFLLQLNNFQSAPIQPAYNKLKDKLDLLYLRADLLVNSKSLDIPEYETAISRLISDLDKIETLLVRDLDKAYSNIPEVRNRINSIVEIEKYIAQLADSLVMGSISDTEKALTAQSRRIFLFLIIIAITIMGIFFLWNRQHKTLIELNHVRNYLSNIIDSMPSVLIGVDIQENITQWNKSAEQTTGLTAENVIGKILWDVVPEMIPERNRIIESIRTGEIKKDVKKLRKTKSCTLYENITIYPLIDTDIEGAVIRIDNVTDGVRMEEMMVQSEKMLSVGGLAAGMAHEINNPLAGMIQIAGTLKNRLTNIEMPANKRAASEINIDIADIKSYMEKRGIPHMIDTINESGKRIAVIIENMLSFARKSEDQKSSHDIIELLDKTIELAATDYDMKKQYDFKQINIRKEYREDLPMILCEESKIQQVLLNILRNGSQAMHKKGTEQPQFIIRTIFEKEEGLVTVEIEDNGPGMDKATIKRVFEPFFTTKPIGIGTGLGLSVSYFIITENHGGRISVESVPGSGAKFIISLPIE